jgi:hydrogenase maturation protease
VTPMGESIGVAEGTNRVRVLCLGNDLIADDGIGISAADLIRRRLPGIAVVEEAMSGLYLIDDVIGVDRLIVVDAVITGEAPPGTIHVLGEGDVAVVPGVSPHYVGLFETLDLVRALELDVPDEVTLVCIEIKDAVTIGGAMTDDVARALPEVVDVVADMVATSVAV